MERGELKPGLGEILDGILVDSAEEIRRELVGDEVFLRERVEGESTPEALRVFNEFSAEVIAEARRDFEIAMMMVEAQVEDREVHNEDTEIADRRELKLSRVPGSREMDVPLVSGGSVRVVASEHESASEPIRGKHLAVFMPTKDGERIISGGLIGLKKEIDTLKEQGFSGEIYVCVNNTTDETIERILSIRTLFPSIRINIYEFNMQRLGITGKNFSLNLLYSILKQRDGVEESETYIHIADDDIEYPESKDGIASNIDALRDNKKLKLVTGTYATSRHTSGFHKMNSVRKNPEILASVHPLPQSYGGAATMRLKDFPRTGILSKKSFDAFMTLSLLLKSLEESESLYNLCSNPSALPVRTNPNFMAEHREEHIFHRAVYRLLRDTEWRETVAEHLKEPLIATIFLHIRHQYYSAIGDRIDELPEESVSRLAHTWARKIRDKIYDLYESEELKSGDIAPLLRSPSHSLPEYEFCYQLINDPERLKALVNSTQSPFPEDERMKIPEGLSSKILFKKIQAFIEAFRDDISKANYYNNPTLKSLCLILDRISSRRKLLEDPKTMKLILVRAGIKCEGEITIKQYMDYGNVNFAYKVCAGGKKYFVRYSDPIGKKFFQKKPPTTSIFSYITAERIIEDLLGKDKTIGCIYPNLKTASRNYFNVPEVNDLELIMQNVIIQPDLSESHAVLYNCEKMGMSRIDSARKMAVIASDLHSHSMGITQAYYPSADFSSRDESRALSLLQLAHGEIRFKNGEEFKNWLLTLNWVTKKRKKDNPAIEAAFEKFCERSARRFDTIGSIGHLDLSKSNTFMNKDDPNDYKIFDFDYVTFVDPAYEAGQTLYSLLRDAINKDASMEELSTIRDEFTRVYIENTSKVLTDPEKKLFIENSSVGNEFVRDMLFIAALTLRTVYEDQVDQDRKADVERICASMINLDA